jgi:hypothetical protein
MNTEPNQIAQLPLDQIKLAVAEKVLTRVLRRRETDEAPVNVARFSSSI